MLAAHILDSCGRPSVEIRPFRERALGILQKDFSEALSKTPPAPESATLDDWHSTWARACRSYLTELEQRGREFDTEEMCPMFPYELFMWTRDEFKDVELLTRDEEYL